MAALAEREAPPLNEKTLLRADMAATGRPMAKYFLADGHYNGYASGVIAAAIRQTLTECR